jgi:hypothetical protein
MLKRTASTEALIWPPFILRLSNILSSVFQLFPLGWAHQTLYPRYAFLLLSAIFYSLYIVRKMDLILRSIERMLKTQLSMARNFTLQPLRRHDVKPPEKTAQT